MAEKSTTNRTALITGASGGIGLALAECFAKDGHELVITARSKKDLDTAARKLEKAGAAGVRIFVEDLRKPEGPQRLYDSLAKENVEVDYLINNAGFGGFGPFVATDAQTEADMVAVNVAALTNLTKLFLPDMFARKHGRILNLASTASFQPGPLMAVYFATKAYVLSFSEAIAEELRGTGVSVTCLCPGPTTTGFEKRATDGNMRLFSQHVMTAEKVAQVGYKALMAGKPLVIPGVRNRLYAFAVRFLPRQMVVRAIHASRAPQR